MNIKNSAITLKFNSMDVDWETLAEVYERAPLGKRNPKQLKKAFQKSYLTCIAFDDDKNKPIAAGRVISDGEYYANIYDVVVLPEYQGLGIGKKVMLALTEKLQDMFMLLTTTIGKEEFYYKLGFRKHRTAMAIYPASKKEKAIKYLED